MNQEEQNKKVNSPKKPMRTFGEEDTAVGGGMKRPAPIKKVDRVIHRNEENTENGGQAAPARQPQHAAPRQSVSAQTARAVKAAASQPLRSAQEDAKDAGGAQTAAHSESKKADVKKADAKKPDIKKPETKKTGAKKSASDGAKDKKGKKKGKKAGVGERFIRVGRGIKTGTISVTEHVRKGASWFERFTSGEDMVFSLPKGGMLLDKLAEKLSWIRKMGFSSFIILTIVLMAVILTFFNNTSIQVENVTVSIAGLSSDLEGYTICLISDLHGRKFGTEQATLLRAINGEDYDLMLVTGDMVGVDGDPQPFYDLLEGLSGGKPVYFIAGDSDPGPIREEPNVVEGTLEEFVLEDWVLGAIERGAIYLDAPESLTVDDSVIWLTPESMLNVESSSTLSALNKQAYQETNEVLEGLDIGYRMLPFTSYRQQNMEELQNSILEMETTDLHISVAHIPPASAPRVSDGSDGYLPTVDLMVAGHYCGGVWKLPIIGAVYIPSVEAPRHGWFPSQDQVEGLTMLGSVNMYVSGGLGVTDRIYLPDFRFNNQPKVTLLHLTAKLTDDLLGLGE